MTQAKTAFREAEELERKSRRLEFGQNANARITEFDAYWLEPKKVDHVVGQYRGLTLRIKASVSHRDQWVGCYLTFPFEGQEVAIPDYTVTARTSQGVMSSIDARLRAVPDDIAKTKAALARVKQEDAQLTAALAQAWEQETRFVELSDELDTINTELRIAEQAESAHEAATTSTSSAAETATEAATEQTTGEEAPPPQSEQSSQTLVLNEPDIILMPVPVVIPEPDGPEAFASAFAALVALTADEAVFDNVPVADAELLENDEDGAVVCQETSVTAPMETQPVSMVTEVVHSSRPSSKWANSGVPIFGKPFKQSKGATRKLNPALGCVVLTTEQLDFFDSTSQQVALPATPAPTGAVQLTMAL